MKKTYQNPITEIVHIQVSGMIAAGSYTNPQGFDGTLDETGTSGDKALGRRGYSVWDDDEEEEEEY